MRDARNEDRNAMNRDQVVEGAKLLTRNVFMRLSSDGEAERLTSPDLGLVFRILKLLRIR